MLATVIGLVVIAFAASRAHRAWERIMDGGACRDPYDESTRMGRFRTWLLFHPFMHVGGGSADGFLFIPIYGNPYFDKPWFKATVMRVYRILRAVHEAKWWALHRFHPEHRYNVVPTGLPPGYYDFDTRILHGAMEMLRQYVECSGGVERLASRVLELREPDEHAPEGYESHAALEEEAVAIFRWWTEQLPADRKRRDELLHCLYGSGRVSFKKIEGACYSELEVAPFVGPEVDLHEEFRALEDKISADKTAMLHRLVDIRPGLWT